jgi:hypothetical protein
MIFERDHMKEEDIFDLIMKSSPDEYTYNDQEGLYFNKEDINLRLHIMRENEETIYNEKWTSKFADKKATVTDVQIYYLMTLIKTIPCVWVDGCRYLIPAPRLGDEITINAFEYKIGSVLNHNHSYRLDEALQRAGISVKEN